MDGEEAGAVINEWKEEVLRSHNNPTYFSSLYTSMVTNLLRYSMNHSGGWT